MIATARRTLVAALLVAGLVVALLGSWFASGWSAVRAEQAAVRAAPRIEAARTAGRLAVELDELLEALRAAEDERPYYHYQNLFHDPLVAAQGVAIAPSPLAAGPRSPLIATHFQIDPAGRVTLPTLNEEVPELSTEPARYGRLRDAIARADVRAPDKDAERVEVLEQQAYVQNAQANELYQSVKQARREPAFDERAGRVAVTISAFRWRALEVDGGPALVATRRVETPDGVLTQGVLVPIAAVRAHLASRADGAIVEVGGAGEPLRASGGAWTVTVADAAAIAAADDAADALATGFLGRFVPTAALAAACAGLIVLLVARAERAARQRSEFAAAAAHELRTPLAGLQLYGDMLADGLGDPSRARDYARRVAEEAARLGRVVTNVLDFSRLERGDLAVAARPGDAAAVVRAAAERARPALERAGVDLRLDAPPALPALVDDDALSRILGNLLDNAEKYGRGAADRAVTVTAAAEGDHVTIAVRDAGPGVAPDAIPRLFEPFSRGVTGDGPAGLGLGLALSRSLARAMGGDLTHRATPDGATFVVTLRHGV